MKKNALIEQLEKLGDDDSKRTKTGRLREVLDEVESTLAKGVKKSEVLATLNEHGLDMTFQTFETTLKRLREKAAGTGKKSSARTRKPAVASEKTPVSSETGQAARDKLTKPTGFVVQQTKPKKDLI